MESNLFSSRDVREVFFWKGSTAFAHFADFARGIDSYPFRVFGVFRGLIENGCTRCRQVRHVKNSVVKDQVGFLSICLQISKRGASRWGGFPESK